MTIDEIFASMPEEDAATGRDYLVIDPAARSITVPESEKIFGVEGDEDAARKYFICPRYVGDNLDLAGMFLTVYWRNAGGDEDGYLVEDVQTKGEYVTFSWLLSEKAVAYKGAVQFAVCADLPNTATKRRPDWNTTLAEGEVLEGMDPDLGDLETGSSDVLTQLREMVTTQTAAVEATGAAQVAEVKAQGTNTTQEAVAAIQAQGEATRASIPADYTALAATVDRLTRDRAAAIVCEAAGAAIQVQDASNDPLQGLRIFGRSTQDGTPTPAAPVEIVSTPAPVVGVYGKNLCPESALDTMGINGTSNTYDIETRTITMLVDPTGFAGRYCAPFKKMTVGKSYTVSFSIRGTAGKIVKCGWDKQGIPITLTDAFARYSVTLVATRENEPIVFYSRPIANGGLAAGEYMQFADVQIEVGDVATVYEPYKEAQTLAITTTGSLPGIPVDSGGNYTDANGQQWIADEVDLARGVYVQRVKKIILDGSNSFTIHKNLDAADKWLYTVYSLGIDTGVDGRGYCDKLQYRTAADMNAAGANTPESAGYSASNSYGVLYINIGYLMAENTVEALRTVLAQNPYTFLAALKTPVETPLSDVELQAYLAMHSNKPTTTVLNDAGAHMVLEYAADPKTFICNQIAAAIAAK